MPRTRRPAPQQLDLVEEAGVEPVGPSTIAQPVIPRPGLRFAHARFRASIPGVRVADSPAEVCRVTRVARGSVYYRTGDGTGNRYVIDADRFPAVVGSLEV